ncbi:sensor histidine kinase [Sphingomonas sp.]|uniref:sensor histidine kinase n=1 Tax=Sphingomonas sp. TaxID=28214 RepID=UPI002DB7C9DF|nr:sensor histidine kinase [Sphingomonas sp.]HEU4967510.1 sensor histidine kinase [Sphingomonas sp.]
MGRMNILTDDRHPLRAAIVLAVAFNLFTLAVFTVSGYFRGPESLRESLVLGVPMMLVDGYLGFQLYYALRWTRHLTPALRWSLVTVAVVVIALVQALWDTQLRIWADTLTMDLRQTYIRAATLNTYNSGMLAGLFAFQAAYMALQRNQWLLGEARQREREAQMLALRFQLNPHFLFNTLNAISSLVVLRRTDEAESMIDRLSSFLRGSLAADPDRMVTVEDEFEMLDNYLEIESVRFGDRLMTAIHLPHELARAQVPPFLLQPLVENAVKYAVAPSRTEVRVEITARERGGLLELEVSDSGSDSEGVSPGTGVGLANVRERLRLSFGDEGRIQLHKGAGGFRVTLTMPLNIPALPAEPPLTIAA